MMGANCPCQHKSIILIVVVPAAVIGSINSVPLPMASMCIHVGSTIVLWDAKGPQAAMGDPNGRLGGGYRNPKILTI